MLRLCWDFFVDFVEITEQLPDSHAGLAPLRFNPPLEHPQVVGQLILIMPFRIPILCRSASCLAFEFLHLCQGCRIGIWGRAVVEGTELFAERRIAAGLRRRESLLKSPEFHCQCPRQRAVASIHKDHMCNLDSYNLDYRNLS